MVKFNPKLSFRQTAAWDALHDPEIRSVLYGGAKGGGKSILGCFWLYLYCWELIKEFKLKRSKHPIPVAFMGRKQGTNFADTTLETWKRFIPAEGYRIRDQQKEIIVGGAVKILFGGLDATADLEKFNSAELGATFIDQAEEVTRDDVAALQGSLRLTIDGKTPRCGYKSLWTANPRLCWLLDDFIEKPEPGNVYIPALLDDNPYLPAGYEETLMRAFKHRPELIEAYRFGNWNVFEADNAIISRQSIRDAALRHRTVPYPRRLVVCDVARFGDDETVIYELEETQITREELFGQKSITYTASRLFIRQKALGGCLVVVDDGGVGGGLTDILRDMGVTVLAFNGAEASSDPEHYYNLRAEAWWETGKAFADGDVCLDYDDGLLVADLRAPTYDFRKGRILVEAKAEIKKRLGRSPDRGDTYVMGRHGLSQAWSPEKRRLEREARKRPRRSYEYEHVGAADDPMAM